MASSYALPVDNINAAAYILGNYDKFFDLTNEREQILKRLIESSNAATMTVEELRTQLGVEGNGYLQLLYELVKKYSVTFEQNDVHDFSNRTLS